MLRNVNHLKILILIMFHLLNQKLVLPQCHIFKSLQMHLWLEANSLSQQGFREISGILPKLMPSEWTPNCLFFRTLWFLKSGIDDTQPAEKNRVCVFHFSSSITLSCTKPPCACACVCGSVFICACLPIWCIIVLFCVCVGVHEYACTSTVFSDYNIMTV